MIDIEIKYTEYTTFSSLQCPSCKVNLKPFYWKDKLTHYFCDARTAVYLNTPHYKFFEEDGCGFEIFFIWKSEARLYSVKRSFDKNKVYKIEVTYQLLNTDIKYKEAYKSVTRLFEPKEFVFDSSNIDELESRVQKMVEIAEIFQ